MKAYKGFNKDMTCRGFQYEEGKEYETDTASLCYSGFHACENPLDCLNYYAPSESVYHEVELDDNGERQNMDTKVVGKKIKIGARLSVADICRLHFDFVKEHTTERQEGEYRSSLSAQNWSSLSAQDGSSLSARDRSSLSARDRSSLSARDRSSLSARDGSSLSARDRSSLSAQNWSSLSAQDGSSLSAQDGSSLSAQNWSSLSARDESSLSAQDGSSLSAQDWSSLSGGKNCVISAFNSKAKAGKGSLIALANRELKTGRYKITDFKAAIVDGEKIKADTWYKLENGEFVEVEDEES